MLEHISSHFIPILISTIICFALGSLWYSQALFGKKWMELIGKDFSKIPPVHSLKNYTGVFFVLLLFNFIMSIFIDLTDSVGMTQGIITGIGFWIGFSAATVAINFLFEERPRILFFITVGYALVIFVISGALFGMWR
ncbi:MAG: DUF1761 domain-containing protein [Bacteroidota bacterium]|nr:DUF1761 domain-containing protein [Bacteroidota bacterium]